MPVPEIPDAAANHHDGHSQNNRPLYPTIAVIFCHIKVPIHLLSVFLDSDGA
jgi:hypothetical protein